MVSVAGWALSLGVAVATVVATVLATVVALRLRRKRCQWAAHTDNPDEVPAPALAKKRITLVLIGPLEAGKSTTANFLLGRSAFPENHEVEQHGGTAPKVQEESNTKFNVVDTPGLGQPEQIVHTVMEDILKVFTRDKCIVLYVSANLRIDNEKVPMRIAAMKELLPGVPFIFVKTRIPLPMRTGKAADYDKWLFNQRAVTEQKVQEKLLKRGTQVQSIFEYTIGITNEFTLKGWNRFFTKRSPCHPSRLLALVESFADTSIPWRNTGRIPTWHELRQGTFSYKDFCQNSREQAEAAAKLKVLRWKKVLLKIPKALVFGGVMSTGTIVCVGTDLLTCGADGGVGTCMGVPATYAAAMAAAVKCDFGASGAAQEVPFYKQRLQELSDIEKDARNEERLKEDFLERILGWLQ